ncbi:MAG: hypothetical protein DRP88_00385 [Candidatus Neomarinimicrobiota bacterium]|nr:MAG: hypothetical protein DRP88_00385 [Candidatus Neomarinimicrobiota bacterium]
MERIKKDIDAFIISRKEFGGNVIMLLKRIRLPLENLKKSFSSLMRTNIMISSINLVLAA